MGNPGHSLRVAGTVATLLGVSQHARHVGVSDPLAHVICRASVRGESKKPSLRFMMIRANVSEEGGWWLTGRG